MKHQILEDLRWRHATKKFDSTKKVAKDDLDILFEAMRLSASSINSQPWQFIVIESNEARERLDKTFSQKFHYNQPHVFDCSQIILFAHNPRYIYENFAEVVDKYIEDRRIKLEDREKAFASFMYVELNTDEKGNTGNWTKAQIYLALGNTLHTLARLRIDSTPLEGIDAKLVNEEFKKELGGYRCEVALAIGYHHAQDDYNAKLPKSRLSLNRIFKHI